MCWPGTLFPGGFAYVAWCCVTSKNCALFTMYCRLDHVREVEVKFVCVYIPMLLLVVLCCSPHAVVGCAVLLSQSNLLLGLL